MFSGYALDAGWIWKGDIMVADVEELETMDVSEIYAKRLNAKEVILPKENGKFIFPVTDGRIKIIGGDQELKTSILIWDHPIRGEGQRLENQKRFHLSHLTTLFRMPVKRWMTVGPCQETSKTAITLNPESNFTRRKKNHSLFHWNTLTSPELHERIWMLSKNVASMTIGISMGQEICLLIGQVSLSLLYEVRNIQTNICCPGGDWQESSWHQGQIIYGQNYGRKWERMPSWRRGKSGHIKNLN